MLGEITTDLREEIEATDEVNLVALSFLVVQEIPEISRLSVHIARNVYNTLRRELEQLVQEELITALS